MGTRCPGWRSRTGVLLQSKKIGRFFKNTLVPPYTIRSRYILSQLCIVRLRQTWLLAASNALYTSQYWSADFRAQRKRRKKSLVAEDVVKDGRNAFLFGRGGFVHGPAGVHAHVDRGRRALDGPFEFHIRLVVTFHLLTNSLFDHFSQLPFFDDLINWSRE